jgi:hypothetical protein
MCFDCGRDITDYPSVVARCCKSAFCADCFLKKTGKWEGSIYFACSDCRKVSPIDHKSICAIGIMLEEISKDQQSSSPVEVSGNTVVDSSVASLGS